jgi:hypothetical protein
MKQPQDRVPRTMPETGIPPEMPELRKQQNRKQPENKAVCASRRICVILAAGEINITAPAAVLKQEVTDAGGMIWRRNRMI